MPASYGYRPRRRRSQAVPKGVARIPWRLLGYLLAGVVVVFLVGLALATTLFSDGTTTAPSQPPSVQSQKDDTPLARNTPGATATPSTAPVLRTSTVSQPTAAPSDVPTPQVHTVEAGDNLFSLAQRYGTSIEAIMAANEIVDRNQVLRVGQQLRIPPPVTPPPRD